MFFDARYRSPAGRIVTETVEAADRAGALDALARRGIHPISLSPASGAAKKARAPRIPLLRGLAAGLIIVALGGAAVWFLTRPAPLAPKDAPVPAKTAPRVAAGKPSAARTAVPATNRAAAVRRPKAKASPAVPAAPAPASAGDALGIAAIPSGGKLIASPLPDTVSDQVLAMATSAIGNGDDMPPLPAHPFSEKEFRESLKHEIVVDPDDSPQVKALKERVKAARAGMLAALDEGMTVDQVLNEHQKTVQENARIRKEAIDDLTKLVKEGDVEGAKNYRETVNRALEKMGIAKLTTPVTQEERDAQVAARKERLLQRRLEKFGY